MAGIGATADLVIRSSPQPVQGVVETDPHGELPAPARALAVEPGIEQEARLPFGQAVMTDHDRKAEQRIVVAGVFPVEQTNRGCGDAAARSCG